MRVAFKTYKYRSLGKQRRDATVCLEHQLKPEVLQSWTRQALTWLSRRRISGGAVSSRARYARSMRSTAAPFSYVTASKSASISSGVSAPACRGRDWGDAKFSTMSVGLYLLHMANEAQTVRKPVSTERRQNILE